MTPLHVSELLEVVGQGAGGAEKVIRHEEEQETREQETRGQVTRSWGHGRGGVENVRRGHMARLLFYH